MDANGLSDRILKAMVPVASSRMFRRIIYVSASGTYIFQENHKSLKIKNK